MFSSLLELTNYSFYSSKARKLDSNLKQLQLSDADLKKKIDDFIRSVLGLENTTTKLQIFASLLENSRLCHAAIISLSSEILTLCCAVLADIPENRIPVNVVHIIKLSGMLHVRGCNEFAHSEGLLTSILRLMNSETCSLETGLVCGNTVCLVLMMIETNPSKIETNPSKVNQTNPPLINQSIPHMFDNSNPPLVDEMYPSKINTENFNARLSAILENNSKEFSVMCILTGIFSVGRVEIFIDSEIAGASLLKHYLTKVLENCFSSTSLTFQHFSVLKVWTIKTKETLTSTENSQVTAEWFDKQTIFNIIHLCQGNFENPSKGVPGICRDIYRTVLSTAESVWKKKEFQDLLGELVKVVLNTKWSQKSKYVQLCVLVPLYGTGRILVDSPSSFGEGLASSLKSNHITHAGVEVYKLYLADEALWRSEFSPVLCRHLLSDNQLARQNARDHWLPTTLARVPAAPLILTNLLSEVYTESNRDLVLLAKLDILRISRRMGSLDSLDADQQATLQSGLIHPCPDVRCAAFSILCECKKRGTAPSGEHMRLISEFVNRNATEDSPRFRQCVQSQFTLLMIRCRDFSAQATRMLHKNRTGEEELLEVAAFLDKLMHGLVCNLVEGANYQRKISSLQFLNIFIDNFVVFSATGANKCSGNGDPAAFLEFAHSKHLLVFRNAKFLQILLASVEDKMGDVRDISGNILKLIQPDQTSLDQVYARGLDLLRSPKDRLCESGCILLKLVTTWTKADPKLNPPADNIAKVLLSKYEGLLSGCSGDLVTVALEDPLHGTLSALNGLLLHQDSSVRLSFDQADLERLIRVLESSTTSMLGVLGGSLDTHNPSFEESAKAINRAIEQSATSLQDDIEGGSLPASHQLVLSAVWHNIKSCALLAGELVVSSGFNLLPAPESPDLNLDMVNRCGNLLVKILTLCRHKGALEGTVQACLGFAARLVAAEIPEYRDIPAQMLQSVFVHIRECGDSSITRRSAGLPGLVQALVAAEAAASINSGTLLKAAVGELIHLAQPQQQEEVKDTTAGHALHILRGIVQDAAVSRHLGPFINQTVETCLQSFESTSWSERNAALQLFGALTPRILGQKKLRNESSGHNKVNLGEVMVRFPGLVNLLLDNLAQAARVTTKLVSASVVPVLTLLARLEKCAGPETESQGLESSLLLTVSMFLSSPVIQVRSLAGKIVGEFSSLSVLDLLREADGLIRHTNHLHGILIAVKEATSGERVKLSTVDETEAKRLLGSLHNTTPSFLVKESVLQIVDNLQYTLKLVQPSAEANHFNPGYFRYTERSVAKLGSAELIAVITSGEEGRITPALDQASANPNQIIGCCDAIFSLLKTSNPRLLHKLLQLLNSRPFVAAFNAEPEMPLDVLEAIKDGIACYGLSLELDLTLVKSNCLNAMLMQADWAWFFGDSSQYVADFVENTEKVLQLADPTNVEDSRLNAAACLSAMAPALSVRNVRGSMTPLLQYGLVNLMNAALILLQDEDGEVRNAATRFASVLRRSPLLPQNKDICSQLGIENVIYYGLSQLTEVVEMLNPLQTIFNTANISHNSEDLADKMQNLFKRGDGVNVFAEPVYMLLTAHKCIRNYCESESLRLSLNVSQLLENSRTFVDQLELEKDSLYPTYTTISGFYSVLRVYILLNLLTSPNLLQNPLSQEEEKKIAEFKSKLKSVLPSYLI